MQVLKHAFVLRLSLKRISEAEELENLINNLFSQETDTEAAVEPVLQLLVELKTVQTDTQPALVTTFFVIYLTHVTLSPEDIESIVNFTLCISYF